ncbi:FHA domain-containing protein [Candidatus Sumerlaeota bacterium]|nr:FHA domain-containing protein [Candidatus Sumerlaeota bacterium]
MDESYFEPDSERFPVLSVLIGPHTGTIFTISKPLTTIGRGEDRDIQFLDRAISRMHCEIQYVNNTVVIRDTNSQNGIRVNGRDTYEQELRDGDQIDIGSIRLMIKIPEKEEKTT